MPHWCKNFTLAFPKILVKCTWQQRLRYKSEYPRLPSRQAPPSSTPLPPILNFEQRATSILQNHKIHVIEHRRERADSHSCLNLQTGSTYKIDRKINSKINSNINSDINSNIAAILMEKQPQDDRELETDLFGEINSLSTSFLNESILHTPVVSPTARDSYRQAANTAAFLASVDLTNVVGDLPARVETRFRGV